MINRTDYSGTETVSGYTSALDTEGMASLNVQVNITAASGGSPTLIAEIETSDDAANWSPINTFRKMTGVDFQRVQALRVASRYYRIKWTIAGSGPSFTFEIISTLKDYEPRRSNTLIRYADLTLNSTSNTSTVFQSVDAPNISVVAVRSSDGLAVASFIVQASNDSVNWVNQTGSVSIAAGTNIGNDFSAKAYRFWRLKVSSAVIVGSPTIDILWGASS